MSRPWERRVLISPKLVLLTICAILPRVIPVVSAIFSWGHPRRLSRRITVFLLAFCRARMSEIHVLTVCWITPSFSARTDSVHLHSGSVDAISRPHLVHARVQTWRAGFADFIDYYREPKGQDLPAPCLYASAPLCLCAFIFTAVVSLFALRLPASSGFLLAAEGTYAGRDIIHALCIYCP